jgi:hypothetical protein
VAPIVYSDVTILALLCLLVASVVVTMVGTVAVMDVVVVAPVGSYNLYYLS